MALRAIIFCVDGTLANTERDGHRPAFNAAFAEMGLPWHWGESFYGRFSASPDKVFSEDPRYRILAFGALVPIGTSGLAANLELTASDTTPDNSDVPTRSDFDRQSLRIIYQVLDRLDASEGEPVMVADKKIAWPAQMSIGRDGQGTSPEHVREIMTQSMESLIHHFKLVKIGRAHV